MTRPAVHPSTRPGRPLPAVLAVVALALIGASVGVAPAAQAQGPPEGVDLDTFLVRSGGGLDAVGAPTSVNVGLTASGTQRATGVELMLSLPTGAHLVESGHACTEEAGTVTCPLLDQGPNGAISFPVTLRFDEAGTFVLTSSATADQADVDGDSGDQLEITVVDEEADLVVGDGSERALAGREHHVRHFILNRGPTNAGEVAVHGTFPEGAELVEGSFFLGYGPGNQAPDRCVLTATTFTCDPIPGIEASAAAVLSYDVALPEVPGPIEATATVVGRNDPDPTNDTGTLTLELARPTADLRLDLLALGPVPAGEPFDVTLWTWNAGDGPAEDVVSTVEVPEGWQVSLPSVPPDARSCEVLPAERLVRCTYDRVEPDTRRDLLVSVTPPADGRGEGTVQASTETPTPEAGTWPNTASASVDYLQTGVDMVAVSAGHEPELPRSGSSGSSVTWRYRNATPERLADDLRFSIALPAGVQATFLEVMQEGGGVACNLDPLDPNPSCTLPGPVIVGDVEVSLWVEYETGGTFPFTATVSQASGEQSPGDETLGHTVEVATSTADLALSATRYASEVTVGDTYATVVSVRNDGPHDATDVVLRDQVPAGTELVSVRRGWVGWRCGLVPDEDDDGAYACGLGTLAPGAATFVIVTLRATAASTVTSAPTVTADEVDPDPASNTAAVTVEVVEPGAESPVDLVLTRHAAIAPMVAGQAFADVYLVENRSLRTATGIALQVAGSEAANLEVDAGLIGWFSRPCGTTATTTCAIASIPAGGSRFVVVTAHPLRPGVLDTTAAISADQPDADPSSNTVAVTGAVAAPG